MSGLEKKQKSVPHERTRYPRLRKEPTQEAPEEEYDEDADEEEVPTGSHCAARRTPSTRTSPNINTQRTNKKDSQADEEHKDEQTPGTSSGPVLPLQSENEHTSVRER